MAAWVGGDEAAGRDGLGWAGLGARADVCFIDCVVRDDLMGLRSFEVEDMGHKATRRRFVAFVGGKSITSCVYTFLSLSLLDRLPAITIY